MKHLIVPVENQVRELDAKLLFALRAINRGYQVTLGSRAYVHYQIARLPRGIYVAKSTRAMSERMFRLTRRLGHEIVAWEEEALVHPPPDTFYTVRLSPRTLADVSHYFCWGQEHLELLQGYPQLPKSMRMHITGNPRGDLLRPELRGYFRAEVEKIRARHGQFILINTNFSDVNPYISSVGLFKQTKQGSLNFGQAGKGMTSEYALGLRDHKQALFNAFCDVIPALAKALPETNFVLRPHPSEKHLRYQQASEGCSNVSVCADGNVLPWLLASKALIHNGCTTAAEAQALGIPAHTYMPVTSQLYDYDFQGMPNLISRRSTSVEELLRNLANYSGDAAPEPNQATSILDRYLDAQTGTFASDRILDVLDAIPPCNQAAPKRLLGTFEAELKAILTKANNHRPGPNRQHYHDHRFPALTENMVQQRLDLLSAQCFAKGSRTAIAENYSKHLFRITPATNNLSPPTAVLNRST